MHVSYFVLHFLLRVLRVVLFLFVGVFVRRFHLLKSVSLKLSRFLFFFAKTLFEPSRITLLPLLIPVLTRGRINFCRCLGQISFCLLNRPRGGTSSPSPFTDNAPDLFSKSATPHCTHDHPTIPPHTHTDMVDHQSGSDNVSTASPNLLPLPSASQAWSIP